MGGVLDHEDRDDGAEMGDVAGDAGLVFAVSWARACGSAGARGASAPLGPRRHDRLRRAYFRKDEGDRCHALFGASDDGGRAGRGGARAVAENLEQFAAHAPAIVGQVGRGGGAVGDAPRSAHRSSPSQRPRGSGRRPAVSRSDRHRALRARDGWPRGPCRFAPDMRPSVTSATLWPRSCSTARMGGERVQFRHAVGAGTLEADHDDDVAVELSRAEGFADGGLVVKDGGGRPRSRGVRGRRRRPS